MVRISESTKILHEHYWQQLMAYHLSFSPSLKQKILLCNGATVCVNGISSTESLTLSHRELPVNELEWGSGWTIVLTTSVVSVKVIHHLFLPALFPQYFDFLNLTLVFSKAVPDKDTSVWGGNFFQHDVSCKAELLRCLLSPTRVFTVSFDVSTCAALVWFSLFGSLNMQPKEQRQTF